MTSNARLALGAAALLPAVTTTSLPAATEALLAAGQTGRVADGAVLALIAVLLASLGVVLYFAWLAAGADERGFRWRLGWVLALTLFGVVTAPAFWYVHLWRGRASASAA